MKLARIMDVACDLSRASVLEAWEIAGRPERFSLVVGTKAVGVARTLRMQDTHYSWIWVNPEWTSEWMLSAEVSVFSEGV
jgi:hypothetical protein